jgi:hypothetical protein
MILQSILQSIFVVVIPASYVANRPASFYQIAHKAEVDAFQIVQAFQII